MPSWGLGLVYSDNDLQLVKALAKGLGVDTFDFVPPEERDKVKAMLEQDDKMIKKLAKLAAESDVTRFALLVAAAMTVGAIVPAGHLAQLKEFLSSGLTGDIHPAGQTVLSQAIKIYSPPKPLDVVGPGQQVLLAQGKGDSESELPLFYHLDSSGNLKQYPTTDTYPEPADKKPVGCGQWGTGLLQSELEEHVLDIIGKELGITDDFFGHENNEDVRTKFDKNNALNKKLADIAKGKSIPDAVTARKCEAKQFTFAVLVTSAICNGAKVSSENRTRLKHYLAASRCGLGKQGWLELRHAITVYQDGLFLPIEGIELESAIRQLKKEQARYKLAKQKQQQ